MHRGGVAAAMSIRLIRAVRHVEHRQHLKEILRWLLLALRAGRLARMRVVFSTINTEVIPPKSALRSPMMRSPGPTSPLQKSRRHSSSERGMRAKAELPIG